MKKKSFLRNSCLKLIFYLIFSFLFSSIILANSFKNPTNGNIFDIKSNNKDKNVSEPVQEVLTITGRITDINTKEPLIGVSIVIKGTTKGSLTDQNGKFSINAYSGAALLISYIGYSTQEIPIVSQTILDIKMIEELKMLEGVVVTALGIERQAKSLGFSTQRIKGAEFANTKDLNLANAMVGKVAGLQINASTEMFINSDIRLRGASPLIVIDGSPLNTTTWDLNYADIESIDVLKGATASSLYGSSGINGAIVISLKKGKYNKTTTEFTSTNLFQTGLLTYPKVQTEYGSGTGGNYQYQNGSGTALEGGGFTWGPKLDGRPVIQWNSPVDPVTGQRTPTPWIDHSGGKGNLVKFLEPGFIAANNLNFETGNEKGSYRISLTQEYQKGIVPNTRMNIYGVSLGGKYHFSDFLEVITSLNYSNQNSPNYRIPSYGSNDYIYSLAFWLGNDIDLKDSRNYWVKGQEGTQQRFAQIGYYNNPYLLANENIHSYKKDAVYGQVSGNLTFIPDELSLKVRVGADANTINQTQNVPISMTGQPLGNYYISDTRNFTINNDAILSYNNIISDNFSIDAIAGGSFYYTNLAIESMNTNGLVIPNFYNLSNSLNPGSMSNSLSESQTKSVYANINLKLWKPFYLSLTGRNDWVSTLPVINNSYFYPSASLAVVISDWVKLPEIVSFLKLRSSFSLVNTGNTGSTYGQLQTYTVGKYNNMPTMAVPRSLIPSDLKPSSSRTYEIGGNVAFFGNRLRIDLAYFNRLDYNNIILQSVSVASGYTSVKDNGRQYNTRGFELVINAVPVKTNSFTWDVDVNISTVHKYLEAMENDLTQDGYIKLGTRVDQIYMYPWLKDPEGNLILNPGTGLPSQDPYLRFTGYYDPDFIYGIQNNIRYKNFTLSFSFDARSGGRYFSILPRMVRAGTSTDYDPEAREDAANGLSNYVGNGVVVTSGTVKYDGLGNIISDTRQYSQNTTATNYESWEKAIGNMSGNRAESFLPADYLKLRDVSLTMDLPRILTEKVHLSSAQVSIVGSNLWILTKIASVGDDPSWIRGIGTVNADLKSPTSRSLGLKLKLIF